MAHWVVAHAIWVGNAVVPTTKATLETMVALGDVWDIMPILNHPALVDPLEHQPLKSPTHTIPLVDLAIS